MLATSWVDIFSLAIAVGSLAVTIAIFFLGRRISFRQQRERITELEGKAWKVAGPIREQGLNSKIIVMNVDRYKRGYDGSNEMTWRGYAYTGPELIEIVHDGVEVVVRAVESYFDVDGNRSLVPSDRPAPNVIECGHIPWDWIEEIAPEGDRFDGSAIFFVRHRAPGRQPYNFITYRESTSVPLGRNDRDYYRPDPDLGIRRPRFFQDWWRFLKSLRAAKRNQKNVRAAWGNSA